MATTKAAKPVNYTPEQTAQMVQMYTASETRETVEAIAKLFGKSVRSVVAKLSREKVYKPAVYVSKTGAPVALKNDTADAIGKVLNLGVNDVDSLTKATKPALNAIWKMIVDTDNRVKLAVTEALKEAAAIGEGEDEGEDLGE